MKRILFLICCLTISTMMFTQNSFSKELFPILAGLQITECSGHLEENDVKYESYLTAPQEEITINDKKYLKWGMYSLREEKGKILVYSERQNKDFTLYDFTLKKGDKDYVVVELKGTTCKDLNKRYNREQSPIEQVTNYASINIAIFILAVIFNGSFILFINSGCSLLNSFSISILIFISSLLAYSIVLFSSS